MNADSSHTPSSPFLLFLMKQIDVILVNMLVTTVEEDAFSRLYHAEYFSYLFMNIVALIKLLTIALQIDICLNNSEEVAIRFLNWQPTSFNQNETKLRPFARNIIILNLSSISLYRGSISRGVRPLLPSSKLLSMLL